MRALLILIGALVAFVGGYMSEPALRPHLTAKPPATLASTGPIVSKELKTITITRQVSYYDSTAAKLVGLTPGTEVKLLRVEDDRAIIYTPESSQPVSVELAHTSLSATPAPEPVVVPAPIPEPIPEPVAVEQAPDAPDPIVKIMQQSIRDAEIKAFEFDQVREWNPGPEETIGGETYQTGTLRYDVEMLFGDKTYRAKALIKDGKVVRWTWPDHGMDIK